ncbi:MAG: thiamine phosphate synthase [Pseudomonadota bacterium]
MTEEATSRLYLLLPQQFDGPEMVSLLKTALATTPVACVRLDLGTAEEEDWIRAANHVIGPCHEADVALVVTDHFRLVDALGLDGVHLSAASRTPLRDVRKELGDDRIVGAFAGASRHQGMVLAEAGADYVSFGPVGSAGSLGDDAKADDEIFQWWGEMIETPSVAEGGVTVEHAARLSPHVDFVAPDRRIWDGPEILQRELTELAEALS